MIRILRSPSLPAAGFSQIEVLCAVVVLALAAMGLARTMIASSQLANAARQRVVATQAARQMLEELQGSTFANVFRTYDSNPDNDPNGAGTAAGAGFSVTGLEAALDDADGMVGEVVFPSSGGQLREDSAMGELGMPHDLNADGAIDAADHSGDYQLLPVLVRVRWRSDTTPMKVELRTILAER